MEIIRIIIYIIIALYLILAFFFVHISLKYSKQLKKSKDGIYSLFASQIALFEIMEKELNTDFGNNKKLKKLLSDKEFTLLNKELSETERNIQNLVKQNSDNSTALMSVYTGIEDNVNIIRNEIYRHNKLVDNINVNYDSVLFALFIAILRIKKQEKI